MTELSPEIVNKLYKNTIKYLYDISNIVPKSQIILKSYYASKFRIFQHQAKISFKEKTKLRGRCLRCCLKLMETRPMCTLKPEPQKPKFMRKLQNKVSNNKRLTRFQTKYLKKLRNQSGNSLVIRCNFCMKELIHNLHKPKEDKNKVANVETPCNTKKPEKKKDLFCGRKKDAVVSVQNSTNENKTIGNPIKGKKAAKNRRSNLKKLSVILNQKTDNPKTKNNLSQFLQSFQ